METAFLHCAYHDEPTEMEQHFHNAHELIYVQEGTARFRIGSAVYEAGPHSLLIISKLETHSVELLKTPYRRFTIRLTSVQLDQCVSDSRLKAVFLRRPAGFCHCFDLSGAADEADRLFALLEREGRVSEPCGSLCTKSLFALLLILCFRTNAEHFPSATDACNTSILQLQTYLDTHFAEDLTVEQLAHDAYMSPSYLSHAFREWTGYSPKQYIMYSRLSFAKERLRTTQDSITAVAMQAGFRDVNNFIRSFKKETGVTPAAYRREGYETD